MSNTQIFQFIGFFVCALLIVDKGRSYVLKGARHIQELREQGERARRFNNPDFIIGLATFPLALFMVVFAFIPLNDSLLHMIFVPMGLFFILGGAHLTYCLYLTIYRGSKEANFLWTGRDRTRGIPFFVGSSALILMGIGMIMVLVAPSIAIPIILTGIACVFISLAGFVILAIRKRNVSVPSEKHQ